MSRRYIHANLLSQSGVSLIELTLVILITTIASVPILGQFTLISSSTLINEEIQTASQLAQERAEDIISIRRDQGFAAIPAGTTTVLLTGDYAGYTRVVNVTEPPSFDGCAANAICKGVNVLVSRGNVLRAEISYLLVNY